MATFTYTARDGAGIASNGRVIATSVTEAARQLRGEGKFVVQLREQTAGDDRKTGQQAGAIAIGGVRKVEVVFFLAQMSLMIEAGVPVAEALDGIIRQSKPGTLRNLLRDVLRTVEAGTPFSEALARHPRTFPSLVINLVRAAEMSGRLPETLRRTSDYLKAQRELAAKVRGALLYPLVLATVGTAVITFLLVFLLPKFTSIYAGKEDLLPLPTRMVMAGSSHLSGSWLYYVAGLLIASVGAFLYLRSRPGRRVGHWILLHMPITGPMVHKALITRSLHTLGTLIDSGVSMLDSVAITRRVSGNHYFEQLWDKVSQEMRVGKQLSTPLYENEVFPRPLAQMIDAGERSGKLGMVMRRISTWLEEDLRTAIASATKLIEPLMIIIIGSVVGGIAISLLLPIFTLARSISH